jgi:hypothetical protein
MFGGGLYAAETELAEERRRIAALEAENERLREERDMALMKWSEVGARADDLYEELAEWKEAHARVVDLMAAHMDALARLRALEEGEIARGWWLVQNGVYYWQGQANPSRVYDIGNCEYGAFIRLPEPEEEKK